MKCNGKNIRFINKNNNENERKTLENWWTEATNLYGTLVSYYVHTYDLSAQDFITGEMPTAPFEQPVQMLAIAQMNNDALLLSKFGIMADAELVCVIPIRSFAENMGNAYAVPKAGDLIRLDEVGWDRPGGGGYPNSYPTSQLSAVSALDLCQMADNGLLDTIQNTQDGLLSGSFNPYDSWLRGPNVYEITERRDENIPGMINPLMSHIVWYIKCKRFDYSGEPYAPREHGYNLVNDNTRYGKLSGTPTIEPSKRYTQNSEDEAKKSWDYDQGGFNYEENGNRSSVYGGYGKNDDITP